MSERSGALGPVGALPARDVTSARSLGAAPDGAKAHTRDAFPHTRRPLPWFLAGFLALLFLVPIDSTQLSVNLPVGSDIDRFAVVVLVLAWMWFGGDQRTFASRRRSKLFVGAACVFLACAVTSLLLDSARIINLNEINLASKRFALLGSFLAVSWFTMTALRARDLRGIASYVIGLGTVTALGMLYERHSGNNLFYSLSSTIFSPIARVGPSPTDIHPALGSDGRVSVVGPTLHGLAVTTMLAVAMPFALVRVLDAVSRRARWLNALAFALMLVAALSTDRKTALLAPVAAVLYLALYRGRQLRRYAPLGVVVLVALVHVAAPGSLGTVFAVQTNASSNSTTHREGDFANVLPDVLAHPIFGRGFGTLNPDQHDQFRINDDEYLDEIWQVGILGLAAYLWMILAPIAAARRVIRSGDPDLAALALAASAGCVAYLVINGLFDAMSFPQAPYIFFVVAGMCTVATGDLEPEPRRVTLRSPLIRPAASRRPAHLPRAAGGAPSAPLAGVSATRPVDGAHAG